MRFHKLKTMGLVCLVVFSLNVNVRGEYYPQLIENSMRRVRSSFEIPVEYQLIVNQLNHCDPDKRIGAIEKIKEIVINQEKDERVRGALTLKVADKLSDPEVGVHWAAVSALEEIIPCLKEESLKELALKVADMLNDPRWVMRSSAVSVLDKIIPFLKEESLKELALKVADMLNTPEGGVCLAVVSALREIIPFLKEDNLKELALKVADMLNAPSGDVRWAAVKALDKIIPSLKEGSLKEELTLKVADMLSDPNGFVREAAVSALGKIGPLALLPIMLEKLYTDTDFFDKFSDILYQLRVAQAYDLINKVVNYNEMIEDSTKAAKLSGNSLFKGIRTVSLLWIYQNISEYLRYSPDQPEFKEYYPEETDQEIAVSLQEAVEKLENGDSLSEELEEFLKDFIHWTIQEVIGNELEAQGKNSPSVGGKLHFVDRGDEKELMRAAILEILGIKEGAGFFASGKKEYLFSAVHSVKNLVHMITSLKTMGLIQEPVSFQYTIKGRMMDEVKYIGWLMRGLLPEIQYNVTPIGKSAFGPHSDIVHGGGNLDVRKGEEKPQHSYDRTDFLFLWTTDNFEEIVTAGQYFSYLLQNDKERYEEFVEKLKDIYSKITITKEGFEKYIKLMYRAEDREKLLRKIDEIPWDEEGKVSLDWIFTARWFNDNPRQSSYGPRYEASWDGVVLQVVLHEAAKAYFDTSYGKGSFAELLRREILDLYLP